jgi:hypothetical protein
VLTYHNLPHFLQISASIITGWLTSSTSKLFQRQDVQGQLQLLEVLHSKAQSPAGVAKLQSKHPHCLPAAVASSVLLWASSATAMLKLQLAQLNRCAPLQLLAQSLQAASRSVMAP